MRFSIRCASAVLASGLALSACSSSTGSSSVPSSVQRNGATVVRSDAHGLTTKLVAGVKQDISCDYSAYAFCIYVTPGNPGPYVHPPAAVTSSITTRTSRT